MKAPEYTLAALAITITPDNYEQGTQLATLRMERNSQMDTDVITQYRVDKRDMDAFLQAVNWVNDDADSSEVVIEATVQMPEMPNSYLVYLRIGQVYNLFYLGTFFQRAIAKQNA